MDFNEATNNMNDVIEPEMMLQCESLMDKVIFLRLFISWQAQEVFWALMQRNEEHQRSEEHEELRWNGSLTVTDTAERYQALLILLLSVREA